jgi:hypothetical protein
MKWKGNLNEVPALVTTWSPLGYLFRYTVLQAPSWNTRMRSLLTDLLQPPGF